MKIVHALLSALLIAALLPIGCARAQETDRYQVVIWGKEEVTAFSLRDPEGTALVERCSEPCRLILPRGKYRLELLDAQGADVGARSLAVRENVMWTAAPQNTGKRDLGLGLGIVGLIALNVGAVVILTNIGGHDGSDSHSNAAAIGLLTMIGGAIATPIGWAMFFGNLRPRVEVHPLEGAAL